MHTQNSLFLKICFCFNPLCEFQSDVGQISGVGIGVVRGQAWYHFALQAIR